MKAITQFSFNGLTPAINATINDTTKTITATVPSGTDVTALVPTITISDKALISPNSGIAQNFSKEIDYTVTAEDGTTQLYKVNVVIAKSSAKSILTFTLPGFNPPVTGTINENTKTITAVIPQGSSLAALSPIITVSPNATVSPASATQENFTNEVDYVVTAADGSKQTYKTTITVANPKNTDTLLVSTMIGQNMISHFQYDNNRRLVSEIDSGNIDARNVTIKSSFNYDTQGNLIKREVSGPDGDTVYNITYVNGLPASASYTASFTGGGQASGIIKYTVTDNKITEIDGSVYPTNLKVKLTYSGNNIASISTNGGFADALVNYTYGTKKSPYAVSAFKWFLFLDCLPLTEWRNVFSFEYPVNIFNQNDLESLSAPGRSGSTITFTNQYNSSDYPTQIQGNSGPVTYQYVK